MPLFFAPSPFQTKPKSNLVSKPSLLKTAVYSSIIATLSTLSITTLHAAENGVADSSVTNNKAVSNAMPAALSVKNSQDGIVALANDTPILKSQLVNAIKEARMTLTSLGQPIPSEAQLQKEVLNGLILRSLQIDLVKRAGIRPTSDAVNQRLLQIAQSQGLSNLSQLQSSMDSSAPGSYGRLREQVIAEASIMALQQMKITERINVNESDIEAFLNAPEAKRLQQREYRTVHIRIPYIDDYNRLTQAQQAQALNIAEAIQAQLKLTDDASQALDNVLQTKAKDYPVQIQGGDMGYHPADSLPAAIADQIMALDKGEVSKPLLTAKGIDIVKLLDVRDSSAILVPQWQVRHILIKTDDTKPDGLAEQEINEIYEQLRRDADFKSLAATYSDDAGSAGRSGSLGWVTQGDMVPEFEAMMLKTSVGDFSAPFKSQFGWHILQVTDQRERDLSKQELRNKAANLLYQRLAPQAQEDWLQELRANAYVQVFN